jgi:phage gp46-like protein
MDLKLIYEDDRFDLAGITAGDLAADDGLETAVIVSLFTDRRASRAELPVGQTGRRGWWGDEIGDADPIGSKLWLLHREKQLPEVAARAREYAREALEWLIDDGIAESVEVGAEIMSNGVLGLSIEITRPSGQRAGYRYQYNWEAL